MENQFPPVIAFGKLDKTSIYEEDGFQFAHYLQDDELVHEFGINDSLVQITDIVKGRRARWSFAPDIKKLFHLHFCIDYDFSENNPIVERLVNIVKSTGNFYVSLKSHRYPSSNDVIVPYFRKVLVRVPLAIYDFGILLKALEVEAIASSLNAIYPVFIQATEEKAGIVSNNKYLVANLDFITHIACLPEFCRILVDNQVISAGKMHQAIVMDLHDGNFTHGLTIPGNTKDSFFEYVYPFQEHFLFYSIYWNFDPEKRVNNWINQYNKWQDSLNKQSSSFQYCILPFILKKIMQEGFQFKIHYSMEEILQSKICQKNNCLWLENTSPERIKAERDKRIINDQKRLSKFMNHLESGKGFDELSDEDKAFWINRY